MSKLRQSELRSEVLLIRDSTPLVPRESFELAFNVLSAGIIAPTSTIAGYWPIRREADTRPLLRILCQSGHNLSLPVLQKKGETLIFRSWRSFDALQPGKFGTWQPWPEQPIINPTVLLLPLVVFDGAGGRIGYGGGHYDRTLAVLRKKRQVAVVGLARELQRVHSIPLCSHDQLLDWVITEKRVECVS